MSPGWEQQLEDAAVQGLLNDMASTALGAMRRAVPVDTGKLRSSLFAEVNGTTLRFGAGAEIDYAWYVELGTRKMRAQPYIRPALDAIRSRYGR
jgi:HK97 gp10 family phage protein